MIVTRTPLRMSFVGGGSDMHQFYSLHGGAVLSTTIAKYVYVMVNKKFDESIRLAYSQNEEVSSSKQLQHPLVRAALGSLGMTNGLEITTIADIPSSGTGLGSSSSFTVGLLNALTHHQGRKECSEWLASSCCHIEIDICGEPIGKQDQYAAAYGGLNCIRFLENGNVAVEPIRLSQDTKKEFENSIIVFYTGITRSASKILKQQSENLANNSDTTRVMKDMVAQVFEMKNLLESGQTDHIGELLNDGWKMKRSLTRQISSEAIDNLYNRGLRAGASGGKLLGAGAGGFLMFYAPPEKHNSIRDELSELKEMECPFCAHGSQIILNDNLGKDHEQ